MVADMGNYHVMVTLRIEILQITGESWGFFLSGLELEGKNKVICGNVPTNQKKDQATLDSRLD